MDPRNNRVTRPTANARPERAETSPQTTAARQYAQPNSVKQPHKPSRKQFFIVIGLLVLLALTWGTLSWLRIVGPLAGVKSDKYQAVFLTNDQVYFGKISGMNHQTITLGDVYYLKQQDSADEATKEQPSKQVQLAKLGSGGEVHNPDNEMRINRDQVLFWENIKDDSQVVKTIKQAR